MSLWKSWCSPLKRWSLKSLKDWHAEMKGLSFQVQKKIQPGSPNRMDIACFVGLVKVRPDAPRDDIDEWLSERSWMEPMKAEVEREHPYRHHREFVNQLLDVPVPIDSWERFDQLFDWDHRRFSEQATGACYLATAVRSFFAQGGRFCYVIQVACPLALEAGRSERKSLIDILLPGNSHPTDRTSWHGIGHLLGLPDVSMLCVPDLPDLFKTESIAIDTQKPDLPEKTEQFVECSEPLATETTDNAVQTLPAPVAHESDYQEWASTIHQITRFIDKYRKDVQLIAAIPLPHPSSEAVESLLAFMHKQFWFSKNLKNKHGEYEPNDHCISSRFIQLCYPWLQTAGSLRLPQGVEPPDGTLAGQLARNAISRGAYRSISGLHQNDVQGLYPQLSQQEQFALFETKNNKDTNINVPYVPLTDRISLFGFTPQNIALLSDVTTSNFSMHRPAGVNRIISMVNRVVRQVGEAYMFENNGEALWAEITQRLNDVFRLLFDLGALRGKQAEDAFYVRCDRSTMTQQDLDSGRVIVEIQFNPAASIESIEVILAMQQNGSVSLSSIGIEQAVA